LYGGTAGIALFLASLDRHARLDGSHAVIDGALRHSVHCVRQNADPGIGFYDGVVGVAYTALVASRQLNDASLALVADELLASAGEGASKGCGVDVVAGAAGSIPALLRIAREYGRADARSLAGRLGEYLLDHAVRGVRGWSWPTTLASADRHMTGYAHGASGCGAALLDLYIDTGAPEMLYGAIQAAAFEREFYSRELGNWAYYRNATITEHERDGTLQQLGESLLRGAIIPTTVPTLATSWCYGAPGMVPWRTRLHQLVGGDALAGEIVGGLRCTWRSVRRWKNMSMCHGAVGNLEAMRVALANWQDEDLSHQVDTWCAELPDAYMRDRREWITGAVDGVPDPTLMLGSAGLGYFCLRTFDPSLPSILFMEGGNGAIADRTPAHDWRVPHDRSYARVYFPRAFAAAEEFGLDSSVGVDDCAEQELSPPERAYMTILEAAADLTSNADRSAWLAATLLERKSFALAREFDGRLDETAQLLVRWALGQGWKDRELVISGAAKLVHEVGPTDEAAPESWMLVRNGMVVSSRRATALQCLLFQLFDEPQVPAHVLSETDAFSDDAADAERAREQLALEIARLLRSGVLRVVLARRDNPASAAGLPSDAARDSQTPSRRSISVGAG
jgi:hypothetical protein